MSKGNFNLSSLTSALAAFSPQSHSAPHLETATFAGGCFWCMEHPFEQLNGVEKVVSGYTGGFTDNPTYEEVCSGNTGHLEAVEVYFDPMKISFKTLLEVFWRQVDPTDGGGQFVDRGSQYGTAIFYHSDHQKKQAEASRKSLNSSGKYTRPIATEIIRAREFFKAEEHHQGYYKKCPIPYSRYRSNSGRDAYLDRVWKDDREITTENSQTDIPRYTKPSESELRQKLTPIQYKVTQENGTEPAFCNEYWDNKTAGLYVDSVSGEPLFSSVHKYDSGSGWPSFTKALVADNIVRLEDRSLFSTRTEVRSKHGDSHLGHVFNDGPEPTGQRFCINSAALRFIPKDKLADEGYSEFLSLFES